MQSCDTKISTQTQNFAHIEYSYEHSFLLTKQL